MQRLDPVELAAWMQDHGDLAKLRANGLLGRVLKDPPAEPSTGTRAQPGFHALATAITASLPR